MRRIRGTAPPPHEDSFTVDSPVLSCQRKAGSAGRRNRRSAWLCGFCVRRGLCADSTGRSTHSCGRSICAKELVENSLTSGIRSRFSAPLVSAEVAVTDALTGPTASVVHNHSTMWNAGSKCVPDHQVDEWFRVCIWQAAAWRGRPHLRRLPSPDPPSPEMLRVRRSPAGGGWI